MIVGKMPSIDEFYRDYWGKKPFVVRNAIENAVFDQLIDGDSLAGLALEEELKSRLVITQPCAKKWNCEHGPFLAERFSTLKENNWSLLVQNVEQYHHDTALLLQSFNFSPRWLMDDIMVSYSVEGGSVGPHFDSYHVFLVQGKGRRKWKIGCEPIANAVCVEDAELLVLKDDFEGVQVEVGMGDVVYIPPYFGHQGVTLQEAMTFSVGFLGPQLSEILGEYSHYLEQNPQQNTRYCGQGLGASSGQFTLDVSAVATIQSLIANAVDSELFSMWMAEYFSLSTHGEVELAEEESDDIIADLYDILKKTQGLYRLEHIKMAITYGANGVVSVAMLGHVFVVPAVANIVVHWLNGSHLITADDIAAHKGNSAVVKLVAELYEKEFLCAYYGD